MTASGAGLPAHRGRVWFGKYELLASLGQGGMADVFLAVASSGHGVKKLVVVKRPRGELAEEKTLREMLLDEARLAARLNHPNVVQTYEVGDYEGTPFLAMEFLEGQPLNRVMREALRTGTSLPTPFLMRIASDALAGLHYAHELSDYDGQPLHIIHRDVSPQNVFVTYDGQAKIVDFGIAKAAGNSSHTEAGSLKGKIAYMAPEQASELPIDHRADIFSMGIVCWELATGRRLIAGDSPSAKLYNIVNAELPRVSTVLPDVDSRLDDIIAKALEKDPDQRFQTALAMREALEEYIARSGLIVLPDAIGKLTASLFAPVRAEVAAKIKEHMAGLAAPTLLDARTAVQGLYRLDLGGTSRGQSMPDASMGSLTAGISAIKSHSVSRAQRPQASTGIGVLLALVFGGVAAALVLVGAGLRVTATRSATTLVVKRESAPRMLRELGPQTQEERRIDAMERSTPLPRMRPARVDPPAVPALPSDPSKPKRRIDTAFPSD